MSKYIVKHFDRSHCGILSELPPGRFVRLQDIAKAHDRTRNNTTDRMAWTPVLAGPVRDAACRKIHEIADIIREKDCHRNTHGLMAGNAGEALFLYYFWRWSGNDEIYEPASERFLDGVERVTVPLTYSTSPLNLPASFYDGISGIGWEIGHLLYHRFIEGDISDTMGSVDAWLYRRMIYDLQQNKLSLFRGATGIGLYAVGRDNRLSKEYLRRFVAELYRAVFEQRIYDSQTDCSVAGGIGAMILLLVKIGARHPDMPEVPALLDCFRERLIVCIQDTLRAEVPHCMEMGWKDGLLSVLWVALCSRLLDQPICDRLMGHAIATYRDRIADSKPFDAGMAGGIVSAAHVLNRMYHLTGNGECGEFARTLYGMELDAATCSDPYSGYKVWLTESDGLYGVHTGLLNGLAGIGLALLAAVSDMEPAWDECLMMS